MSEQWQYQLRIGLDEARAALARGEPEHPSLRPLNAVLARHDAALKCQFDAFAGYVAEAERHGRDDYPLYEWTKATIENPAKREKYLKSFTLYVGGAEVYARDKADALERDLEPLLAEGLLTSLSRHDTNPANNPQPPKRYRR